MSHDLRHIITNSEPERRKAPRSKWAPGSWQKAAAYNSTKPEVRSPVIVGGNSIIRTPEDLRDLCQLPSVPSLIQTTETTLYPSPDDKAHGSTKETFSVCDVSLRQWLDVKKSTEGDMITVWFHGQPRSAWLPQSRKT